MLGRSRSEALRPEKLRKRLDIPADTPVLLVFCGSSGSQRINDAVQNQLSSLCARFAVVHVRGKGNLTPALKACTELAAGLNRTTREHLEPKDLYRAADLLARETIAAARPRRSRRAR
ncbi:glycosyltransferase [Streptomyces paludis]|uniref:glycosyltransferase n=1 Tax=Streptomyces paludis TaxID=2282738 RepID=UPI001E3D153C|nr:glycosyltransferase [Streptomyces paludis]